MFLDVAVFNSEDFFQGVLGGGILAAFLAIGILLIVFLFAVWYVYTSLALRAIAKKLKYKNSWLAWIPFARHAMVLQLGGFHWAWIFLILIPFFGWIALFVMTVIAYWRILEKRSYNGALSLVLVGMIIPKISWLFGIAFLVLLGVLAWGNESKVTKINLGKPKRKAVKKKVVKKRKR